MSNESNQPAVRVSVLLDLTTDELRVGDIVHDHGMEVLLELEPSTWTSRNAGEAEPCTVYGFIGTVTNMDEVRERDYMPLSFLTDDDGRDDVWVVQGNHLARWSVERSV